jgi:hypothetical protein
MSRRLLEVLNKADEGCVVTTGHKEVKVSRHEAVRNDVKPVAGGARRQAFEADGNEAAVFKPRPAAKSVQNQVVRVAPFIVEGTKSGRRSTRFESHGRLQG